MTTTPSSYAEAATAEDSISASPLSPEALLGGAEALEHDPDEGSFWDRFLPRDGGKRDRVSNLLNIADGLLGDHLKLHVIVTSNVPLSRLDPAIVRPGRLVGTREFRRLTRSEAQRLAEAKGLELPEQEDFSLADVNCAPAEKATLQTQRIEFA